MSRIRVAAGVTATCSFRPFECECAVGWVYCDARSAVAVPEPLRARMRSVRRREHRHIVNHLRRQRARVRGGDRLANEPVDARLSAQRVIPARSDHRGGFVATVTLPLPAIRIVPGLGVCFVILALVFVGPVTLPSVQCARWSAWRAAFRLLPLSLGTTQTCWNVNRSAVVDGLGPPAVRTERSMVPAGPAGAIAVILEAELTVKLRARRLPKLTALAPEKSRPVIVTRVPPVLGPRDGETDAILGVGITYVN
jgi:hypothetical protein